MRILRKWTASLLAIAVVTVTVGAVVIATPRTVASSADTFTNPMPSAIVVNSRTYVTIPMGHLNEPLNTFWQVLTSTASASKQSSTPPWIVATPEGVADNGGMVMTTADNQLTLGFVPSQLLAFSPLATATDGATTWSPGVLSSKLAPLPNALATTSQGTLFALTTPDSGTIVEEASSQDSPSTVTTAGSLSRTPAAKGCSDLHITAVAVVAPDTLEVGTTCKNDGVVGVFSRDQGHWQRVPEPSIGDGPTEVLRLGQSNSGATVVAGRGSSHMILATLTAPSQGSPVMTGELTAPHSGVLVATDPLVVGPGVLVAVREGLGVGVTLVGAQPDQSETLPTAPRTTVAAVPYSHGVAAFSVQGSTVTISYAAWGAVAWTVIERRTVPIPYGSS